MTQKLGIGKVLAIQALSASYGKLPNALARARNEKVACSSQVTSSIKTAVFTKKTAVFLTFMSNRLFSTGKFLQIERGQRIRFFLKQQLQIDKAGPEGDGDPTVLEPMVIGRGLCGDHKPENGKGRQN